METIILNVCLGAIIVGIVTGAALYIYRAKKRGSTCIGCPHAKQCCGKCGENRK